MRKGWHSVVAMCVCLAAASGARAQGPATHAPGIYAEVPGKTGDEALVQLRAVMLQSVDRKGRGKQERGLLGGSLAGAAATVRVPSGPVAFDFYLSDGQRGAPPPPPPNLDFSAAFQMPMNFMPPAKSAEEFTLLRLTPEGDARHVQAGKNSPSAVPVAVERLDKNVFRVRPKAPLAAGEYAFMWAALASQLWEFGVEP